MANHFRTDRVSMEIKREVNEILQKKVPRPPSARPATRGIRTRISLPMSRTEAAPASFAASAMFSRSSSSRRRRRRAIAREIL